MIYNAFGVLSLQARLVQGVSEARQHFKCHE